MKYDIDLSIKILSIIAYQQNEKITITNLKTYSEVHAVKLEEHLNQLVEWNMLIDTKPTGPGKARIISFARPPEECIVELIQLKVSTDRVNQYFPK